MRNNVPYLYNNVAYMKASLCANVQLNSTNLHFNLKSSLTPFFAEPFNCG